MDRPGGAAGLSGGSFDRAVDSPQSPRLCTAPRCLDRRLMRRSRVPVLSLDQHDLVYDPGGLRPVSPVATGRILRSSGLRLSAVPTPRIRHPEVVIPCGTTTFKQLSRLDTDPADLLHPVSDVCLLPPAGFTTGLVASLCPWKDLHLLDNLNWFHRGSHPQIPTVTSLTRHDRPMLGLVWGDAADPPDSPPWDYRRASDLW